MASAQVVKTSVPNNSLSQNSSHPDDHFLSRYVTPEFKPLSYINFNSQRRPWCINTWWVMASDEGLAIFWQPFLVWLMKESHLSLGCSSHTYTCRKKSIIILSCAKWSADVKISFQQKALAGFSCSTLVLKSRLICLKLLCKICMITKHDKKINVLDTILVALTMLKFIPHDLTWICPILQNPT